MVFARGIILIGCLLLFCSEVQSRELTERQKVGSEIFSDRCSACHSTGLEAKIGPGLRNVMRGHRLRENDVRQIVKKGRKTMPPFGTRLSDNDLDALMEYLKTL